MTGSPNSRTRRWIPLLVVGIFLNTLGIVLSGLGTPRYLMMGAGLVLIAVAMLQMLAIARADGENPAGADSQRR